MAERYTDMKGEEFARKILDGERNLPRIRIPTGFDLSGHDIFPELQDYLKKQDMQSHPLVLDNSQLIGIKAQGIYLPYVQMREANLCEADLRRAKLWEANLYGADLRRAILSEADLREANLREADLREADLSGANLERANLERANLYGANLCEADLERANLSGVYNLERALGLGSAVFGGTFVTSEGETIIRKARKEVEKYLFIRC